jgi:hypothetical protein
VAKRPAINPPTPGSISLREFVYLDDVSVNSLLASLRGAAPAEYTSTDARGLDSEVEAGLEGGAILGKASARTKAASSRTSTSQVVRRASVQSAFKDLHEALASSAIFGSSPTADYETGGSFEPDGHWVVDPATLERGRVIELEVELQTEAEFRAHAVMAAFVEMFDEGLGDVTLVDDNELERVRVVTRLLDRLMTGLVPIRGRATHYSVVEIEGRSLIAHQQVLEALDPATRPAEVPLYVVGVAEQSLFWRDIRRVAFSNSRYRLFGRIAQTGLQTRWTPLKLLDVIREVAPQVEGQLAEAVGEGLLQSIAASASGVQQSNGLSEQLQMAAVVFVEGLAADQGRELTSEELKKLVTSALERGGDLTTIESSRRFFGSLREDVDASLGSETTRIREADWRLAAARAAGVGLGVIGSPIPNQTSPQTVARFIESEVVALYW